MNNIKFPEPSNSWGEIVIIGTSHLGKSSTSRNQREGRYAGVSRWWKSNNKPKHVRSNRWTSGNKPSAFSAFCVLKTRADQHW